MLFSSSLFLFYFLPLVLLCYFCFNNIKYRNYLLLAFSYIFFIWGGTTFTLLVTFSILYNYLSGLIIEKYRTKWIIGLTITGNLLFLGYYKYFNFLTDNINFLLETFQLPLTENIPILLPVGISFYTFHAISYLLDVYYQKTPAQHNILDMGLYIILFPQLVAGPIIRYTTFSSQLYSRAINITLFSDGIERFIIGLGKKILIANVIARLSDAAFSQPSGDMDYFFSWVGAIAYAFQLYFDFSGYSDMAIGLSKMFGFQFPENFNHPYQATGFSDFWKRWHISLSTFFRDYLYIPLGGSHCKSSRNYINLIIVFLITGLWHGSNYTFILWGIIHVTFLILEKIAKKRLNVNLPLFLKRTFTFLVIVLAWVTFRSKDVGSAFSYYKNLFHFNKPVNIEVVQSFFSTDLIIASCCAIIIAFTPPTFFSTIASVKLLQHKILNQIIHSMYVLFLVSVLIMSSVFIISGTFNPFIYYQF